MTHTVKVFCAAQCRRFFVDTFQDLQDQLQTLVGVHPRDVVLTYTDDDGDVVTLSTEVEFRAAVASVSKACLVFTLQQPPQADASARCPVYFDAAAAALDLSHRSDGNPASPLHTPSPSAPPGPSFATVQSPAVTGETAAAEAHVTADGTVNLIVAAPPGASIDRVYRIPCPRVRNKLSKIQNYGFAACGGLPSDAELRVVSALLCTNQQCNGKHRAGRCKRPCRGPELLCQLLLRAPPTAADRPHGSFHFVSRKTGRTHPLIVHVELDVSAEPAWTPPDPPVAAPVAAAPAAAPSSPGQPPAAAEARGRRRRAASDSGGSTTSDRTRSSGTSRTRSRSGGTSRTSRSSSSSSSSTSSTTISTASDTAAPEPAPLPYVEGVPLPALVPDNPSCH